MINPIYFFDEKLQNGFKIKLESPNIIHAKSLLTIIPNFPEVGIETRYFNKILKAMATFYAGLTKLYKFKYFIFFSASFYNFFEDNQRTDETERFIKLNFNHNLTEIDINDICVIS